MNAMFDDIFSSMPPVRHFAPSITSKPVNAIMVKIGSSRRLYTSKKAARRAVGWRILYESGRMNKGDNAFFKDSPKPTWANKHYECECSDSISTYAGEVDGYDSSGCQLHNRYNGYYKRLHQRIVRWLAKGYIAPESGLKDDSND